MGIVSYAQNFEDVMLWRALGHIERGFYIDVGAQDPIIDSVSKAFYEHGWRGIHVEPTVFYAGLMRKDRPDELVIQAAIAQQRGLLRFFEIPDTGLSTASPDIAEQHRRQGHTVRETTATALTLDDVFALAEASDIHWLKIDVEGFEKEVLSGWLESAHRPWIIVIESTYPNSQQETHQAWESQVLAKGYTAVYVDGLNRYYLAEGHEELKEAFRFGPNWFDGFQLTESSWSAGLIKRRYEEKIAGIDRQRTEIESQLAAMGETLARAEAEAAEREGRSREEAEQRLEAVRAEAQAHMQQLIDRERALSEQLIQVQREARQAVADQSDIHTERERALRGELEALRETLARTEAVAAERERRLREQAEQKLEAARAEAQAHMQQLIDRERAFAEQLAQVQREARQVVAKQSRSHTERERALRRKLDVLRETLSRAKAGAAEREGRLRKEAEQKFEAVRAEAQAHMRQLIDRDRAFAERLAQVQREAQQAVAEQGRIHSEREQVLQEDLDGLRETLARAETGAAERERSLREEAEQRLEVVRAEAQAHMQQLIDRERASSDQLSQIQREAAEWQSELNAALLTQSEARQALQLQLAEFNHQIEAARNLEATLRVDLSRQAGQTAIIAAEIAQMRQTLSWRLTAPLRRLGGWRASRGHPADELPGSQAISAGSPAQDRPMEPEPPLQNSESASADPCSQPPAVAPVASSSSDKHDNRQEHGMGGIEHVEQLMELHDGAFVEAAYQTLLGRAPDPEGMRYYQGRLRAGCGKASVIAQLAESAEAKTRGVDLAGLRELLAAQRKASHWFWGIFSRGRRIERQVNRLEYEVGHVAQRLARLESLLHTRFVHVVPPVADRRELQDPEASALGFHRAIPHEKDIHWQLKRAIAMNLNGGKA